MSVNKSKTIKEYDHRLDGVSEDQRLDGVYEEQRLDGVKGQVYIRTVSKSYCSTI